MLLRSTCRKASKAFSIKHSNKTFKCNFPTNLLNKTLQSKKIFHSTYYVQIYEVLKGNNDDAYVITH